MAEARLIEQGTATFSVEGRVLRELGERLVRQPEVALAELIKNAYDADSTRCEILLNQNSLKVVDDGAGMTKQSFLESWMRVGTSSKSAGAHSPKFSRPVTGEKGIGRFAVRYLGRNLILESVAQDEGRRTRLQCVFDWQTFDKQQDLGGVKVPYTLHEVPGSTPLGTKLHISGLRVAADDLDFNKIRTQSLGVISPIKSLLEGEAIQKEAPLKDPGFSLDLPSGSDQPAQDVAAKILERYAVQAIMRVKKGRLSLRVYLRGRKDPFLDIVDRMDPNVGDVYADIRFFPRRAGAFAQLPLDGRAAYSWVRHHSGVAVFDRAFRVSPYGSSTDDWLELQRDAVRNRRDPRSSLARKYFPMSDQQFRDTRTNWMLRLPEQNQLIGVVQVAGSRGSTRSESEGLVAAADREGFVENEALEALRDAVRGAVEGIAYVDRAAQLEAEQLAEQERVRQLEEETQASIEAIRSDPDIPTEAKRRLTDAVSRAASNSAESAEILKRRERQLQTMSLLGVVAGFMTHEFGAALQELAQAQEILRQSGHAEWAQKITERSENLQGLVQYSTTFIRGVQQSDTVAYPVLPRIRQAIRTLHSYASERSVVIETTVDPTLVAPLVPPVFYTGIAVNLLSNALKAVVAHESSQGEIALRAWNSGQSHFLQVSDNGVGIPESLRDRVFDPLFTTTSDRRDPLASGMGLGLTLVQEALRSYGGRISVVDPPPAFSTCFEVILPLNPKG